MFTMLPWQLPAHNWWLVCLYYRSVCVGGFLGVAHIRHTYILYIHTYTSHIYFIYTHIYVTHLFYIYASLDPKVATSKCKIAAAQSACGGVANKHTHTSVLTERYYNYIQTNKSTDKQMHKNKNIAQSVSGEGGAAQQTLLPNAYSELLCPGINISNNRGVPITLS